MIRNSSGEAKRRVTSEKRSTFINHTIGSESVQRASPEDRKPNIKGKLGIIRYRDFTFPGGGGV